MGIRRITTNAILAIAIYDGDFEMKVNVLQVEEAKFKKFRFWSNWVDVAVYDYSSVPFLLQMRVSRFNAKRFKSVQMTGTYVYRQATCREIGDLTQMEGKNEDSRTYHTGNST